MSIYSPSKRNIILITIIILGTSFLATKTQFLPKQLIHSIRPRHQFIRTTTTMTSPILKFEVRKSTDRGKADHGWLKSFHTFSFADYYHPKFQEFGPLRVINEDRVAPGTGFPTHRHREFEIFSYILNGELSHKDSMNNVETLVRGDVQYTTGGTGISHSEYNNHAEKEVHFLQIWVKPGVSGLTPTYYTRHHPSESKRDVLVPIVAPVKTFPAGTKFVKEGKDELIPIHQDMRFYATILSPGKSLSYTFQGNGSRLGYIHLAQMSGYNPGKETGGAKVDIGGTEIREGDGIFVRDGKSGDTVEFKNTGDVDAEFVWFDMGGQYGP